MNNFKPCPMECAKCGWCGSSADCRTVKDEFEWDTWHFWCPRCNTLTDIAVANRDSRLRVDHYSDTDIVKSFVYGDGLKYDYHLEEARNLVPDLKPWHAYLQEEYKTGCPYDEVVHACGGALPTGCSNGYCRLWTLHSRSKEWARKHINRIGLLHFVREGRVLDKMWDYYLIDMRLPLWAHDPCLFLLMKNPSTQEWHLEGVPRDSYSVRNALHRRKPEALRLIPVSDQGDDWYQQGDVCIWPEDAIMVKEFPIILT